MSSEFCDHLIEYGISYGRAEASYKNCIHIMDTWIGNIPGQDLKDTLEKSLDDWVSETRNMQQSFEKLVKKGNIELANTGENGPSAEGLSAICAECHLKVPRLEFTEFDLSDELNPKFRNEKLPLPVGEEA